jgi:hypothetical protein
VILKELLEPIHRVPGKDGSLWAEFDARRAALLKKTVRNIRIRRFKPSAGHPVTTAWL